MHIIINDRIGNNVVHKYVIMSDKKTSYSQIEKKLESRLTTLKKN